MNNPQPPSDQTSKPQDTIEVSSPATPPAQPSTPPATPPTAPPPPTPEPKPAAPPPQPSPPPPPPTPTPAPAPEPPEPITPPPFRPTPAPTPEPPEPTPTPPIKETPKVTQPPSESEIPIKQTPPTPPPTQNTAPKPQPKDFRPTAFPPVKHSSSSKAVATIASVAFAFLALGFLGGFFGYKYVPKFRNMISTSADENATTQEESSKVGTPSSNSTKPGEVSAWPIYSNTKYQYSIKYPDTWYNQGANDPTSKTVQFSSFKPEETGSSSLAGFKVEIVLQDANGKNLKDWVDANNVTVGNSAGTPKQIQVSGQAAFQQQLSGTNKNISTYISRSDKVMIVTYYGPDNTFDEGKALYDKMIESIKLM